MRTMLNQTNHPQDGRNTVWSGTRENTAGAEEQIRTFLQKHHPSLLGPFETAVPQGKKVILERLAAALLREDILGLYSSSCDLHVMDAIYALNVPALDERWCRVIRRLQAHGLRSGASYKLYTLPDDHDLAIPVGRQYAFRRMEIAGDILLVGPHGVQPLTHPGELVEWLWHKECADQGYSCNDWGQLLAELQNGCANLALAIAYWSEKKKRLQRLMTDAGCNSALAWVLRQKQLDPQFDACLFFEQLCVEGHHLHPGAKTKMGMHPADVFRYAPEFDGVAEIRFVGIHREFAEWAAEGDADPDEVLFAVFPEVAEAVEREFAAKGLKRGDYIFTPVHAWQWEHAIPEIYREELTSGRIVPVESLTLPSAATSSFRTVVPLKGQIAVPPLFKVAVNSQMTSTVRSISPQTAVNGPAFTRLIRAVLEREPHLAKTFVPLNERTGIAFKPGADDRSNQALRTLKSRNLTSLLRDNPHAFTAHDELAIVASGLYAESPFSGKPLIQECMEQFASSCGIHSMREAARMFVREYAAIALPGYLTLMVKYGIGLEGHMQNSIPVFRHGRPVRMLFRDWGGARIFTERLERQQLRADFRPGSVTITDSLNEMQNKVFYTVIQSHLGEVIRQLCGCCGTDERELWREVRQMCDLVFARLGEDPSLQENLRQDMAAFYRPEVEHKALTAMRLDPESKGYRYATVPNPLTLCEGV